MKVTPLTSLLFSSNCFISLWFSSYQTLVVWFSKISKPLSFLSDPFDTYKNDAWFREESNLSPSLTIYLPDTEVWLLIDLNSAVSWVPNIKLKTPSSDNETGWLKLIV